MSGGGDERETRSGSIAAPEATSARGSAPRPGGGATTFAAGDLVATRYRIERFVARGGMGEVYEAVDLELGAQVALKTLPSDQAGDSAAEARFKQEILLARQVTHPNVCRLFDIGFHFAGGVEVTFITMELLAGETLAARLARAGAMTPAEALPIVRQMAAGLDAAHAAGVVHRDFKSENVLLVAAEPEPRAVITDFGLAHRHREGVRVAATSDFVGSPAYMAPEQVTRRQPITPAADLYALGVVLFEMVTGRLPFTGDTALAIAARRVEEEPPAPRAYAPALDRAWNAAILRCLRREPGERFASAGQAVAALTGDPRRRRRRRAALLAALLLVVAGGAALALRGGARPCGAPAPGRLVVAAGAPAGGNGSLGCPFATVTSALAAAGSGDVVDIGPGIYDRAHGERFPLVVPGGVSVAGAGAEQTLVVGTGGLEPTSGSLSEAKLSVTMVVGDAEARTEVTGLTLSSGRAAPVSGEVGVACLRGNLRSWGAPIREPNTILRAIAFEPGYDIDAVAATSTAPEVSGCHLRLSDSQLRGAHVGLWLLGCGAGDGMTPAGAVVERNRFLAMHDPSRGSGAGLRVWDCARRLLVDHNQLAESDYGMQVIRHPGPLPSEVVIAQNEIDANLRAGVALYRAAVVERLEDNTFSESTGDGRYAMPAALLLDDEGDFVYPRIMRARRNQFRSNAIGVQLVGRRALQTPPGWIDFGRPGDPGENHFRCNSSHDGMLAAGQDLRVDLPGAPGMMLGFAGNTWDHAPPTVVTGAAATETAANGADVALTAAGPEPRIDTSDARAGAGSCFIGWPGPPAPR